MYKSLRPFLRQQLRHQFIENEPFVHESTIMSTKAALSPLFGKKKLMKSGLNRFGHIEVCSQ